MRVSSLPAAPLTRRARRSVRNLKKPATVISKIKHSWLATQVSHRGKYSIERLLAFQEYSQRTSRLRVFLVCIGTPLPMIAVVVALECVPLQNPNAGWKDNYGLWIRSAVICGVIASTMLIELKHLIEGVTISQWQAMFVLGCVMVGNTALCMTVAAYLAFPIPFMSILMVPPLLAIVAVSLRIAFGATHFKKMLAHPAQMYGFVLFILAQALTLLVYPVYQLLFDASVNTIYELPVMMLLPVLKLILKNMVASSIYYVEDMLPESVIFTVDFFNAVYMATCMQRASSTVTVTTIMVVDVFHTVLALHSLYRNASAIKRRMNRDMNSSTSTLKLLDVGCSLCQFRDKFERQELSQIQLRSCLPHKLSSVGRSFLGRLEKYPLKQAVKAHRRRIASILPMPIANSPPPSHQSKWKTAKRLTAKIYAVSVINISTVKPLVRDSAFRTRSVISSFSVPASRILQRILEILFTTECLVLTEYLESFTPIFYASFLRVMVQLPSANYHTELDGITRDTVQVTVQIVFLCGLLECASFFVLVMVIRRTIGIHALYHLAFVLETQMALIQSKLIVWMLLTLTCREVHYGFDFSFRFAWIKKFMSAHFPWKYLTLDATGTLLRPAEPPGATYLRFWEAASGPSFSSSRRAALVAALTSNFPSEFSLQSRRRPNFGSDGTAASAFLWWHELVLNVMKRADVADCVAVNAEQSERFTRDLYAHFARPEAWTVYDDVRPALEKLWALNVPMGVISNFDERLEPLLEGLDLRSFFDVVTTSFSQPHMKPHASIFLSTFEQMQREEGDVEPSRFLHVGDHLSKDYKAAKDVGAHALLLWRNMETAPPTDVHAIETLHDILR